MKSSIKAIFVILFVCSCNSVFSQDVAFTLLSSDEKGVVIRVDFPGYTTTPVDVNGIEMQKLQMNNAYPIDKEGMPELLKSATSIMIPDDARPVLTVEESDYEIVPDFLLAPSKGRLLRNIDPDTIPYILGEPYKQNLYLFDNKAVLNNCYQLRDFTGVPLICYPFSYNPVKRELKVYKSMVIRIRYNTTAAFPLAGKMTREFAEIYKNHFINFPADKYSSSLEEGEMLIIAPDEFTPYLQPLADWKIRKGIPTMIVPLSVSGNTAAAIKQYIRSVYEARNLAYVIIVGDNQQFPTFTIGGSASDNYYAMLVGDDSYPDILLGKISAENVVHVTTQVEKFIQYERNPVETAHFPVFCGIASDKGPGDNNEYDYEHIRNIDNLLLEYTYTSGYELFEGSRGGLDAPGDPTALQLAEVLTNGVGIVNYAGHGLDNQFTTTGFSNYYVNQLTNYHKLPVIFSVACVNGNYPYQTCFAEVWLRATHNGQPTGAVAAFMSTINQPWNPPLCAQDEINRIIAGTGFEGTKRSLGGISFDGLMKMLDIYNDVGVMNTWLLFGDPSGVIRTAVPQHLPVSHDPSIVIGVADIEIYSPVQGAHVVLSVRDRIVAQGFITEGKTVLPAPQLDVEDTIRVTVSHFNYLPYEGNITLISPYRAYLIYYSHTVDDSQGNQNGNPDYAETVSMNVCLKNVGIATTEITTVTIQTDDEFITLIDSVIHYSGMEAGALIYTGQTFKLRIADYIPYGHIAGFQLKIVIGDTVYYRRFYQLLHAPRMVAGSCRVNDFNSMVEVNARLDLKEEAELQFRLRNEGNSAIMPGTAVIVSMNDYLQVLRSACDFPAIAPGEEHVVSFFVRVTPMVEHRSLGAIQLMAVAGEYVVVKLYRLDIHSDIEDWESNTFTKYEWKNDSPSPWVVTTSNPYEKLRSARSGTISHSDHSDLEITIPVAREDSITFYYYVSCEAGNGSLYDRLEFYIDNVRKAYWDGQTGWKRAAFPVTAGEHTFRWRYEKDFMTSVGEDKAMLDFIVLPSPYFEPEIDDAIQEHNPVNFRIYPNPSRDYISVDTRQEESYSIEIEDITGKVLLKMSRNEMGENRIPVSSLASGMYIIKMNVGNRSAVRKFVKN